MRDRRARRRPRTLVGALCVMCVGVLAACSSDDASAPTSTAASSTSAAAATSTTDVRPVALTLGLLTPPTGLLTDAGVAQQRGVQAAIDDIDGGGGIGGAKVEIARVDQQLGQPAS